MKNLKRALSFALASVMLVGMMVVGAGAASFTDAEDIQHTEAVNSMVALGLIGGRPDGSFDPTATITRAEMAKLLCTAMNGGRDPQLDGECQFEDVKAVNHWASGYIQYCVNMKYVNGRSATIFDPDAPITAQEAAKMMLNAIGYNTANEKFTGEGWGNRVDSIANTKGLYDDVMVLTTAKLSRDDAAQIVWNAMDAELVEYDWYPVIENGVTTILSVAKDRTGHSILTDRFNMEYTYGYMTGVTYNDEKGEFTYNFSRTDTVGSVNVEDIATGDAQTKALTTTADYSDLYGMKVKVMLKGDTAAKQETVYGMYAVDGQVMFNGLVGDIKETTTEGGVTKVKLDSSKYEIDAADIKLVAPISGEAEALNALSTFDVDEYGLTLLDVDSDGKGDLFIVRPFSVNKVTFVGKETMNVLTLGSFDFDENDIAEGIKKDDYVKVVAAENTAKDRAQITKLELVSGSVSAIRKDGSGNVNEIKIDGTWYSKASNALAGDEAAPGDDFDLHVDGSTYFLAEQTSEEASLEDVVYVSEWEPNDGMALTSARARIYHMDGTSEIVNVSKLNGEKVSSSNKTCNPGLYTIKLKKGEYEIKVMDASNQAGFDGVLTGGTKIDETITAGLKTYYIADDAVVIVHADDKVKFYTGKEAKDWDAYTATVTGLYDTVRGLDSAKVVLARVADVTTGSQPDASGDENYGYVTSKPYRVKEGDDYFWTYDLWTKDGAVTVMEEEDSSKTTVAKKGEVIRYNELSNGKVDEVTLITTAVPGSTLAGAQVAITGFDSKNVAVQLDASTNKAYKLTKDTVYLYVDSKNSKGVEGGELALADEINDDGDLNLNAWIVVKDDANDDKVTLLVVEINNKIKDSDPIEM